MVRECKTKGDLLWFCLSFALGKVKIGNRHRGDRPISEAERHAAIDDTIRELRRYNQWKELDDVLPVPEHETYCAADWQTPPDFFNRAIPKEEEDDMCGRFTAQYTWPELVALYNLTLGTSNLQPRYNICPTTTIKAIVAEDGKRQLVPMRWGLIPSWHRKPLKEFKLATFNARVETVEEKPTFRAAFKRTRCLIPASGYYEWHTIGKEKHPYYFTAADGSPILSIAGLWDEWTDPESGKAMKSCAMLITEPNNFVGKIHDRMPVLLEPDQFTPWLSGTAGKEILKPQSEDYLKAHQVSQRVNSSRADDEDATLIEAIAASA